jgi:hypothetical protein
LLKLGIEITEPTVAKYVLRQRKRPSQTWRTFLENHVKNIVSVDSAGLCRAAHWLHSPRMPGSYCCIQRELSTSHTHGTIAIPSGKTSIERVIQQLAVELKADTIRILDRTGNSEPSEATQTVTEDDVPL